MKKTDKNVLNQFYNHHNGGFYCAALTGDCETLVTGGLDSVIRVIDLIQNKQKFLLLGHHNIVTSIALTDDENYIISGSFDASVRVWNLQQKSQYALLKGHKGGIYEVCYLKQQSFIISGDNFGEIIVWDFIKLIVINKLNLLFPIKKIVLMKTENCIIIASGNIVFADIETLKTKKIMNGHSHLILSLALSSDEKRMVSGSVDESIIVWDVIETKKIIQLKGHIGPVSSLIFSLDNRFIVSGSDDHSVRVWSMISYNQLSVYEYHTSTIIKIFRVDEKFLTLSGKSEIGHLEIESDTFIINQFLKYFEHSHVDFLSESKLVGYGNKNETIIWDLERDAVISVLLGHKFDVLSIKISKNSQFALSFSLGDEMNLIYWDLKTNNKLGYLNGHTNSVLCASFSNDGLSAASGSVDKTIRTWNLRTLKQDSKLRGHTGSVTSIKFMNSMRFVVSAGQDKKIIIWNLNDKTQYNVLTGHTSMILILLVTDDDKYLISGEYLYGIRIWNFEKKQQMFNFICQDKALNWLDNNGIGLDSVRSCLKA